MLRLSTTLVVNAEGNKTIYTDGLGRLHFLGRDAANTVNAGTKYKNPEVQELTKKLYEQSENETEESDSYKKYPLKNYINTFPSSRYSETRLWKPVDEATANANKEGIASKTSATATKGQTDYSGVGVGSTILDSPTNIVNTEEKTKKTKKVHWWNKKKQK